jgi:hypothetical protein
MPDEETAAALETIAAALIVVVEEAHELAVASAPEAIDARRERTEALRQAGTDIVMLAETSAVLLRRAK